MFCFIFYVGRRSIHLKYLIINRVLKGKQRIRKSRLRRQVNENEKPESYAVRLPVDLNEDPTKSFESPIS